MTKLKDYAIEMLNPILKFLIEIWKKSAIKP